GDGRVVVDRLGVHRLDKAQLIDDAGRVRQQLAHPGATPAVSRELEGRAGEWDGRLVNRHAGQALAAADVVGQLLAIFFVEQGLVVEEILLGRAAALEQVDDAPDLRREVWRGQDARRAGSVSDRRSRR